MKRTTAVYLPTELRRALAGTARSEKRSQAEVLRRALEDYLRRRRQTLPLSVGIGEDTALSGADSEDWIYAVWRRT